MNNDEKLTELTQKQKDIINQTFAQYVGLKLESAGVDNVDLGNTFKEIIKDGENFVKEVQMGIFEKIAQEQLNK